MPEQKTQVGDNDSPFAGKDIADITSNTALPPAKDAPVSPHEEVNIEPLVPMKETGKDIKLADFTALMDKGNLTEAIEDNSKKPSEEKKEEIKEEVKEEKPIKGELGRKALAERDYTGIDEKDVPVFKQMSKEAFALSKSLYVEHKKQSDIVKAKDEEIVKLKKGGVPDSWYENEHAFVLHPEYQTMANKVENGRGLLTYWQQQLTNMREGKPWKRLGIDKASNTYVPSEDINPMPAHEAEIITNITNVNSQLVHASEQLNQFESSYRTRINDDRTFIREMEKKHFPLYEDEKAEIQQAVNAALEAIPVSLRSSPLAKLLAKSVVSNIQQKQIIAALLSEDAKKNGKVIEKDTKNAGPNEEDIQGGGGEKRKQPVTMDRFEALKY